MDVKDIMGKALELADRREYLGKNAIPCPKCETNQVQLVDHFYIPARWKCRHCHIKYTYEPPQQTKE